MMQALGRYEEYYKNKHGNRKMTWHHELGIATITAHFPSGTKDLDVTLFQAVVLVLFNDSAQLTFREILDQTKLEEDELKRTMQSLALSKTRVLVKQPGGREIMRDDVFSVNDAFESKSRKVHIPTIRATAQIEREDKRAHEEIDGLRVYALDSAIVRYMKQHKTAQHTKLQMAVAEDVKRFKPTNRMIQQRIDDLIAKDYMERDPDDKKVYKYLA